MTLLLGFLSDGPGGFPDSSPERRISGITDSAEVIIQGVANIFSGLWLLSFSVACVNPYSMGPNPQSIGWTD